MHSLKDLRGLQAAFKRHLFNGDNDIVGHIVSMENANNEQRLNTYTNAYYGRLVETLTGDYPAVRALLGEEAFTVLCHDYIQAHPSTHYSLRWFGRHLPAFLAEAADSRGRPFLAELANLEWAFINAFDAADAEVLDEGAVTTIAAEAWPGITITFHPSLQLVDYDWNILDLWRTVRDEETIPPPEALRETSTCLIWRQGLTTRYRILEADEAEALKAARQGAGFAELCEIVTRVLPAAEDENGQLEIALRSAGLLKTWLAEGMVVGLN
ncbi:DNA-binding domain-containing protein [Sulfuriflexus mobilis]|uniref:HvfC/BufC N-terminal domain-containing protein n=1 Tax=Sulfuriflexus mobilis TaxID=1811807 RepID=UPI000F83CBB5|nr:DNA-binding domain-containing protein [Sulfuriflexus mobilis]